MNRIEFAWIINVRDCNPNGDPDAGNAPRVDFETGHGLMSAVCLKRKMRDYVYEGGKGDLFVRKGMPLNQQIAKAIDRCPK